MKHKKRLIAYAVGAVLMFSSVPDIYAQNLSDASQTFVLEKGLLTEDFFKEGVQYDSPVTKQELIAALMSAMGVEKDMNGFDALPFSDKENFSEKLKGYMMPAFQLGLLQSDNEGGKIANPQKELSCQEAVFMIGKALGICITDAEDSFSKTTEIDKEALGYVLGLQKTGLLPVNEKKEFEPQSLFCMSDLTRFLQKAYTSHKLALPEIHVLQSGTMNSNIGMLSMLTPLGIAMDDKGLLYFSDSGNCTIGIIEPSGTSKIFAGTAVSSRDLYGYSLGGYIDSSAFESSFSHPNGIIFTKEGLLVADSGNNAIRLIKNGTVYTYAGANQAGSKDAKRLDARFNKPSGLAIDPQGNIYISDTLNHTIRKIDKNGIVTTVAGAAGIAGFVDGDAKAARLCEPMGLAYFDNGLYIADSGNQRIRLLKEGKLTSIAGGGETKYENTYFFEGDFADGKAVEARFNDPQGLAFDSKGTLYIADAGNGMIRRFQNGNVDTVFGMGMPIHSNPAGAELICEPVSVLAFEGKLIVADRFTNRIVQISLEQ